jgi:hypothetical protein
LEGGEKGRIEWQGGGRRRGSCERYEAAAGNKAHAKILFTDIVLSAGDDNVLILSSLEGLIFGGEDRTLSAPWT